MANICMYSMKIVGEKAAVEEFVKMMRWEDEYKKDGIGRVYSCAICEVVDITESNKVGYYTEGDCAWSVYAAMIDTNQRSILDESCRLGIVIEVYAQELSVELEEHYIIDRGKITLEETTEVFSIYDEEDLKNVAEKLGVGVDVVADGMDDCHYGGFGDWEFTI